MTLGKRIRETRIRRGLTQLQLAEKLGMTEANLSNYERDKIDPPSERLNQIAEILDVTTDYLLGRTNDPHGYAPQRGEVDHELQEGIEFIARARATMTEQGFRRLLELMKMAKNMTEGDGE